MNVIETEGLSKKFKLGVYGGKTIRDDFNLWLAKIRGKENPLVTIGEESRVDQKGEFWALRDINFNIKQGEVVGIIGKNGAGKSTLLKILSRITYPTQGEVRIKGRMASLLEVGTGFHPELTGRENVFLNGAILGMNKMEVQKKFDEIVAFSGIEHHIDTPVKRYSSGMKVRLGFAVAAHLEPEILVVDEVLAVGDAEFQSKCIGKMKDVSNSGRTILFVSHNMSAVRNLCNRGIILNQGMIAYDGLIDGALFEYSKLSSGTDYDDTRTKFINETNISDIANLKSVEVITKFGKVEHVENIDFKVSVDILSERPDTMVGLMVYDFHQNLILVSTDEENGDKFEKFALGMNNLEIQIPGGILKPGKYMASFSIRGNEGKSYHKLENIISFEVEDTITYRGQKDRYRKNAIIAPKINWIKL